MGGNEVRKLSRIRSAQIHKRGENSGHFSKGNGKSLTGSGPEK